MPAMCNTALRRLGTSAPSTVKVAESVKLISDQKLIWRHRRQARIDILSRSFFTHFETMLPEDRAGVHLKMARTKAEATQRTAADPPERRRPAIFGRRSGQRRCARRIPTQHLSVPQRQWCANAATRTQNRRQINQIERTRAAFGNGGRSFMRRRRQEAV
jgi:hypothetical protein